MSVQYEVSNQNKKNSTQIVLDAIRWNCPISRIDIAKKTELSVPSVSRVVTRLISDGYVEEVSSEYAGIGRRAYLLTIKEKKLLTAGIEYDGEQMKISLIDEKGVNVSKEFITYSIKSKTPKEVAKHIYAKIGEHMKKLGKDQSDLFGVGVTLPGIIDYVTGKVVFSSQLGWQNVNFKNIMEEACGTHCCIENDIKATIYGEYIFGAAKASKVAVAITFGSGIGSAAIVDGQILRGVSNSAGELGHITQDANGKICQCGKIGCLQTNLAKSFMIDEARKMANVNTWEEVVEVGKHEVWGKRLLENFVTHAAIAIDTVVCMFNPDIVILCGEMVEDYPHIYNDIVKMYYQKFSWEFLRGTFSIHLSSFRGLGAVIGAGALAQEKYFQTKGN